MTPKLHIGDKNYSSWSMRPWLALRVGGIAFDEMMHALPEMGGKPAFGALSPNAKVPALDLGGGVVIAESLAICEWAAEQQPSLWPEDATARALARAASAIMHSGFPNLRNDAPMNIRRRSDASRMTADGLADAARVDALWREWLARSGGPFLFGRWSIADAMYAPVVTRFVTYAIPRSDVAQGYLDRMWAEPNFAAWVDGAEAETRQLPRSDQA
ncbi:MAG: glutathione S-transferase [Hyphomonadaceae bacterium]|jgi:glutathione S-transferase|nr:glutathione S-transferase [Hyphomonadaceae bacterium]